MSYRVVVVGGGISGLAAAHRLTELGRDGPYSIDITLLEAGQRLGGTIGTEHISGFLVESGPDSFIAEKPWGLQLCERLGIASNLISLESTRRSIYVVHQGSLIPLPEGFILMAPTRLWPLIRTPLFSWPGKFRMALDLFLPRGSRVEDESIDRTTSTKFIAPRLRQRTDQPWAEPRAQRQISFYFSELGVLCVFALAPWSISPGRDNPTRSSCYSTGRVIVFSIL